MTARSLCTRALGLVVAVTGIGCGSTGSTAPPEEWELVLEDNFDGEANTPPDPNLWQYDVGGDGWGNEQLEYNTDRVENASHDGEGNLQIIARREQFEGNDYTSARINTAGLFEQKYGRIEARIKLPPGAGLWPAFWMLGANIDEVPWPGCGEIDIMESRGRRPQEIFGTVHGPGYSGGESIGNEFELPEGETFADDFHIFAVEWDPSRISFWVDGEVQNGVVVGGEAYNIITTSRVANQGEWVFNNPFFLILNLAVGGTVGGAVEDGIFPGEVLVDYVRAYERSQ